MKNIKNYCKFVSQVKSSQVKSSAKIVSLIVLFILLFSISCKPKQEPEKHSRAELVGSWLHIDGSGIGGAGANYHLYVAEDGDVLYTYNLAVGDSRCYYIGKVADTFDSYPYTIKVIVTNRDAHKSAYGGIITFNSAANCEVNLANYIVKNSAANKNGNLEKSPVPVHIRTKVSDKLVNYGQGVYSKEEMWKSVGFID